VTPPRAQRRPTQPRTAQPKPAPPAPSASSDEGSRIDFVNGDISQYYPTADQSAEAKYELALKFIRSGATKRAAAMIEEAVTVDSFHGGTRYTASHVAYHWVLAILSGRSVGLIHRKDRDAIESAMAISSLNAPDEWLTAITLIYDSVQRLGRQRNSGTPDPTLNTLEARILALPPNIQDDIWRHLDPMLTEGQIFRDEARYQERIRTARILDGDRKQRAWKFFQPTPETPRAKLPNEPQLGTGARVLLVAAAGFASGGTALAVAVLQTGGVFRAVTVTIVAIFSGVVAARSQVSYRATALRLEAKEREYGFQSALGGSTLTADSPQYDLIDDFDENESDSARRVRWRRAMFIQVATSHLRNQFRKRAPQSGSALRRWTVELAGIKRSTLDDVIQVYGGLDRRHGAMNWLISWRAKELAQAWRDGKLYAWREEMQPKARIVFGLGIGSAAFLLSVGYAMVVTFYRRPSYAGLAFGLLAVAALLIAGSRVDDFLVNRLRYVADKAETEQRFAAQTAEYSRWTDVLADCPDDTEIARWLDYDKIYVKKMAMSHFDMSHSDIRAYATLTEPARGCVGMRNPFVLRFSVYKVTVFLLTESGIRQVTMNLDFKTGEVYNQVRRSFRHSVISTASVHESGIRYGQERADEDPSQTMTIESAPRRVMAPVRMSQRLTLRLNNGDNWPFLIESIDPGLGDLEDPETLMNLALDTSGIASALEHLEAVAGSFTPWVA